MIIFLASLVGAKARRGGASFAAETRLGARRLNECGNSEGVMSTKTVRRGRSAAGAAVGTSESSDLGISAVVKSARAGSSGFAGTGVALRLAVIDVGCAARRGARDDRARGSRRLSPHDDAAAVDRGRPEGSRRRQPGEPSPHPGDARPSLALRTPPRPRRPLELRPQPSHRPPPAGGSGRRSGPGRAAGGVSRRRCEGSAISDAVPPRVRGRPPPAGFAGHPPHKGGGRTRGSTAMDSVW
jgi:hypothetical protein